MAQQLILSLDIGSSSIRVALYDAYADAVRRSQVKINRTFKTTADGHSEMDAAEAFIDVVAAIDSVLEKSSKIKAPIDCVASCSFWHSLLGVDENGKPTTPIFGWADTRSRKYSDVLRQHFDERATHNRTGAHFHSSFWPGKLLWLREEQPEVFAATSQWVSFSDYVLGRLIDRDEMPVYQTCWQDPEHDIHFTGFKTAYGREDGIALTSISMASATGLFDIRECRWDAGLLSFLGLEPRNLPQVVWGADHTFQLNKKYRRRWKRLKNAAILPAIGDGAADNLGSGCTRRDKAALMVGTSAAVRVAYAGEPPDEIPSGLWCYRIDRHRVIVGGALSDGGGLYRWLRDNLKMPKNAEDEMRRRGAAAHGLVLLPFLAGERSTGYNEAATAAIVGLAASHDSVDLLQAAMEGTAFRLAEIFDRLTRISVISEIVASGGALRDSLVWAQIIADVLGRDLVVNDTRESSLRGAVLLALESLGKIDSIERFDNQSVSRVAFHPECNEAYKKARQQHRQFYDLLTKTNAHQD